MIKYPTKNPQQHPQRAPMHLLMVDWTYLSFLIPVQKVVMMKCKKRLQSKQELLGQADLLLGQVYSLALYVCTANYYPKNQQITK
jgi:hypothetical protein